MNRIDKQFKALKETEKKAMISFLTAGDPDIDTTVELVLAMEQSGADIIELGIPYSDPLADGPAIQASSSRALVKGIKIKNIMDAVKIIRQKSNIPLIYLVYYNSVFKYGIEKFISEASDAGIDGLIIPDLPIEERGEILEIADSYNVYLIPLVAPTSKERIKKIVDNAKGFVYCVSVAGVTGERNSITTNIKEYMDTVSLYTSLPKALGFGISRVDMAQKFKPYCEGIIVGSAIVRKIAEAKNKEGMIKQIKKLIEEIKSVL